ncbi:hypothetical protein [Pseudomonas viridiflava]|uniref:hypothetical protein n=1 Tax=Pseudomonas viridiflava TaxID=33069 RepID=UPI000F023290|nr:hypothetical protein [Pseudomonas viridiflava]
MAKFTFKPDGSPDISTVSISRFAIKDMSQIASYSLTNEDQTLVHAFSFKDGGSVRLSFDPVNGKYSLSGEAVSYSLQDDAETPGSSSLTFSQAGPA